MEAKTNSEPCAKCKGSGRDYTQRYQSWHGCAAHLNSSVCWSCDGTGITLRAQQAELAPVAEMGHG